MSEEPRRSGLRERKKELTRATVEAAALERFLAEGYEATRLEDICADSLVSTRTFFRYFTSKEDLVLGRLRSHLALAEGLFVERANESLPDALGAVIRQVAGDYATDPVRELTRLRLVAANPALATGLSAVFSGFEYLVRRVAASRLDGSDADRHARLIAAAAVAAFRVALDMWVEQDARASLVDLVEQNLADLAPGLLGGPAANAPPRDP